MVAITQLIAVKGDGVANQNNSRMTKATRQRLREQLASGGDSTDPSYLFATTHTALLLAIAGGLVDPLQLAREQLANRGIDANGDWVGFDRARQIHLGTVAADIAEPKVDAVAEQAVAEIARRVLRLDDLATHNSDALDFKSDLAVWTIRSALLQAFAAGAAHGPPRQAEGD